MSLNLATLLAESARQAPDKPAIVINDVVLSYAMVDGLARRFAGALGDLGVRRGQHVALLLPNVPQFTIANGNALIGRYDGIAGLKTGYTAQAGKCLIAYAVRGRKEVLLVLLNAPNRWWDAVDMLDLAFSHAG